MEGKFQKKPRILCLHGYRESAKIFKLELKRWPEFVSELMDLVYIDAPFLADQPTAGHEAAKCSPYYRWYDIYDEENKKTFDQAIAYIEEQMIKLGPFDGVLGVSQGAAMTATLPGMQKQGVALTKVPRIKFVIIISGYKLGGSSFSSPELAKYAFSTPIPIPSLHMIGEKDEIIKPQYQFELLEGFVHPTLLYHHEGHGVPHLDENGLKIVLEFLDQIQEIILNIGESRIICCFYLEYFIASLFSLRRFKRRMKKLKRARVQSLS